MIVYRSWYAGERESLERLTYAFFEAKEADFQSEENLSLAEFYSPEVRDSMESQTSWLLFRMEKLVRWSIDEDILWERFRPQVRDVKIKGKTAVVHAAESYEYELSFADGEESLRFTTFEIFCEKNGNQWYITGISTDNMLESFVEGVSAGEIPGLLGLEQ